MTYEELKKAFQEYLDATNNEGGLPFGLGAGDGNLTADDVYEWEEDISRAADILERA